MDATERQQCLCSALRSAGFAGFCALGPPVLRLGPDGMACPERPDVWLLLLRGVEDVPEPSRAPLDRADPRYCLPRVFSPAALGTNLGPGLAVFHARLSGVAA